MKSGNAVISVCGNFDPDRVAAQLETILSGLDSSAFDRSEPSFSGPARAEFAVRMDREQALVYRSYGGTGIRDDAYIVSELLDEYLSDMSGPLFVSVREKKGMAYFVGANRMVGVNTGMFTLYAGTRTEFVASVRAEFDAVLADVLSRGIPEAELARAKTRLKARRRLSTQTIGARANSALLDTLYGLPIQTNAEYDAKVDAVTADAIRDFALPRFVADKSVDFTIGPGLDAGVAQSPEVLASAQIRDR
jgi:zinc protease